MLRVDKQAAKTNILFKDRALSKDVSHNSIQESCLEFPITSQITGAKEECPCGRYFQAIYG
jgi:hypothetical protein